MTDRPLFIPLCRAPFEAFANGTKDTEYRPYGKRWNERTCYVGRRVTLSFGYGKKRRLQGTVTGFRTADSAEIPDWQHYYGTAPATAACIGITLDKP